MLGRTGAAAGVLGADGNVEIRFGDASASDGRLPAAASRTSCASSGMLLIGLHSSRPSCQQSESSFTAPVAALRRSSEMRTGPTGTPLIATYHSSETESSIEAPCEPLTLLTGASLTFFANAPASAPPTAGADGAFGFCADKLVARPPPGLGGGRTPGSGAGGGMLPVPSVTAERTSIWCPHLRHFMRTVLPATFSSAIWYFALQLSQRNFTRAEPYRKRSWLSSLRSTKTTDLTRRFRSKDRAA